MKADIWIIHDPQPAGVIQYLPNFHPSVCRLHIDLTSPNLETWRFIRGFLGMYDLIIVSSKKFIKPEIKNKTVVIPPAINPLTLKNQALDLKSAQEILTSFGIDVKKPLISQVSRFDPWKRPLEVIEAYKIAKRKIPHLQLALVGFFLAQDDPEALSIFKKVKKKAEGDPDIFLFADVNLLGSLKVDIFVNAIQVASDIILQNSSREGFGLSVTEAMWKGKVVIGGKAEGLKTQIKNGETGFLVSSPKEMARKIVQLIQNPQLARKIGKKAHLSVKKNFLITRLLKDYLNLIKILKDKNIK